MPPTVIQTKDFNITLVRHPRRVRATLKVSIKGVFLYIPTQLPMHIVHDLISEKSDWISQQLAKQPQPAPTRQWQQDEMLYLFGQAFTLQLTQKGDAPSVRLTDSDIILSGRLHRIGLKTRRQTVINWYKDQATIYLNKRTAELSEQTGLTPTSITVKTYKARWGSCNIKGNIQYNWQIIQALPSVIDYLIIHELCHLAHHNHSRAFWQLVAQHHPHYQQDQAWLKQYGAMLQL